MYKTQIKQYEKIEYLLNKTLDKEVVLLDNNTIEVVNKIDLKI